MKSVDRREFIRVAGAGAIGASLPLQVTCTAREKRANRVNVLFLMTDEQHWRSLSSTGNPYIETPHMDRLGAEGVRFNNATCVTPYCSPSRASILTGVYPHRHGILLNVSPGRNTQPALPQDAFSNTESMLHAQGYATGHRGKWHLGDKGDFGCYESMGYAGSGNQYALMLKEKLPPPRFQGPSESGQVPEPSGRNDARG